MNAQNNIFTSMSSSMATAGSFAPRRRRP